MHTNFTNYKGLGLTYEMFFHNRMTKHEHNKSSVRGTSASADLRLGRGRQIPVLSFHCKGMQILARNLDKMHVCMNEGVWRPSNENEFERPFLFKAEIPDCSRDRVIKFPGSKKTWFFSQCRLLVLWMVGSSWIANESASPGSVTRFNGLISSRATGIKSEWSPAWRVFVQTCLQ